MRTKVIKQKRLNLLFLCFQSYWVLLLFFESGKIDHVFSRTTMYISMFSVEHTLTKIYS